MANRILASLPNGITILRLVLILPIVYLYLIQNYQLAFYIFAFAAASDGIDGYLARRYQLETRFGTIADPIADKLLGFAVSLVLTLQEHFPLWLFLLMVIRDIVIVGGGLLYQKLWGQFDVKPLLLSKLNTAMQSMTIACIMINLAFQVIESQWLEWLIWGLFFTTVTSGMQYIWIWGRKAVANKQN